MDKLQPFRRANFFNGLLGTPQFWNEIQEYHFRKELFYNKTFHGVGIIPHVMEQLRVKSLRGGGGIFMLVVHPGVALDSAGRCVVLHEPQALTLDSRKFELPSTVYVTARYNEVLDDYYQNEENSEYHGYRKKIESAKVEIVASIPPDGNYLELARIRLEEDEKGEIREIGEAENFAEPGANTLDFRHLQWAAPAKQGLSPYLSSYLVDLFEQTRNVAAVAHDNIPLHGFREVQTVALTARMLVQSGDFSFEDVIHVIYPFFDLNNQIAQEILEHERQEEERYYSTKEAFEQMRQSIFAMGDAIKNYDGQYRTVDLIVQSHRSVLESLQSLFVTRQMNLHDIAVISHDFPRILVVGKERYTLVDVVDLRDAENQERHKLTFPGTKDVSTSSMALTYPDGQTIRDTVISYVAGRARMTLKNVLKNRKLLIIRRTDVITGNYTVQVTLNDKNTRTLVVDAPDSQNRWRNLSVSFEEDMVGTYTPSVEFSVGEKGRDNFGRVWVYQRL